jgi:hypothetical protein
MKKIEMELDFNELSAKEINCYVILLDAALRQQEGPKKAQEPEIIQVTADKPKKEERPDRRRNKARIWTKWTKAMEAELKVIYVSWPGNDAKFRKMKKRFAKLYKLTNDAVNTRASLKGYAGTRTKLIQEHRKKEGGEENGDAWLYDSL